MLVSLTSCQLEQPINPPLFEEVFPASSGIDFTNQLTNTVTFNILNYLYFYNGGGVAIGDINNDSLPDIFFTGNLVPNRLYLNKGNFSFEDITEQAGIIHTSDSWSTGVTMADVNADGWLDIYVSQVGDYLDRKGQNQLFINQQDGTFQEEAAAYRLDQTGFATQAAFFDFDKDGDLDVYQLNHSINPAGTVGDTLQRYQKDVYAGDRLLENVGDKFIEITETAGIYSSRVGYGLGIMIDDFNEDALPDIYVANDFHEDDYLYLNDRYRAPTFKEQLRSRIGHTSKFSMGGDAADINNDAFPDIMTMDMKPYKEEILKTAEPPESFNIFRLKQSFGYYYQYPRNALQLNQAGNEFLEAAQIMGVDATDWSWSALFWDADLDGYKDLFITNGILRRPNDMDYLKFKSDPAIVRKLNGRPSEEDLAFIEKMPSVELPNQAFQNQQGKNFRPVAKEWGFRTPHFSNGAAYADLDNDGDLDWVVNNINEPASIYRNTAREKSGHNYLTIHLKDTTSANTFGVGAKVYIESKAGFQYRYHSPTRGFQSSVSQALHFGLGEEDTVDVIVVWPHGDTLGQRIEGVSANQRLLITKEATFYPDFAMRNANVCKSYLIEGPHVYMEKGNTFTHQENAYTDFNVEPLIPHMLSREGPDIAVADVNGDGIDDYYICGASGQGGQLFIQTAKGKFNPSQKHWQDYAQQEEVACAFLDVDGDEDPDLLIGCGGNQFREGSSLNRDRLYLNDGTGIFSLAMGYLPEIFSTTATIAVGDYDLDGDADIFLGSRAIPGSYGTPPQSYLLNNDGGGKFSQVADIPFDREGMIAEAEWADMDKNGFPDLILAGEWMPIQIWLNDGQTFQLAENDLLKQKGWWNTVDIQDWDGDGDMDLMAGNLGLNSSMKASMEEPCQLYVGDFDQNGKTDPILCYFREGVSYPMATKDELEKQLVAIRKKFPSYKAFAGKTLEELLSKEQLQQAEVFQTTTFAHIYAEQLADGSFRITELPWESQLSPINAMLSMDVDGDERKEVILGGNQYGFAPNLGRMDAGRGLIVSYSPSENQWEVKSIPGFRLKGEVRSLSEVNRKGNFSSKGILAGLNNNELVLVEVVANRN